ncbi:beta-ketoacyl synthase [Xenorhabdus anantnagensis]|uniref:Beta-ketoacyl synthase n=1 Tax=Xenorhabdus anantnagensis TaxID=3025875 RepID=A0ABT5LMV0_9GAMM|nr:beta-ketoacyl synthase [Xenorhabdus anantnagensis]MDC9595574.1 beta-ketoacyl synthase [Xenorhabdus anantnagensis]
MLALPVIVGSGGINAAGRTSFHQGFRRIVIDKLSQEARQETFWGLATLMNLVSIGKNGFIDHEGQPIMLHEIESKYGEEILQGTLIRKIDKSHFDVDATHWQKKMTLSAKKGDRLVFETEKSSLPTPVPRNWEVTSLENNRVEVTVRGDLCVKHDAYFDNRIKAAGQLPKGFELEKLYKSRNHPRGLQATIFAATDAIKSCGLDWDEVLSLVEPDKIGTYSASLTGQMQKEGFGGMMGNRLRGERSNSKNLALGLNSMSTDFINAYVIGSVGTTFSTTGACATFLYNLKSAVNDIQGGRTRIAIVGSADCAITPEIVEGFANMGALADLDSLKKLDGVDEANIDLSRVSRPFGNNCGFTIGESAQFIVLMDDALAISLGAHIMAAVPDVFVNADGIKKSITAPGAGNYITMTKAVSLAANITSKDSVRNRSCIIAHGSSTPQNRVTESQVFDYVAKAFRISNWKVTAPKAYLGHTLAASSGDQLAVALGIFSHNIVPGISTIEKVADDVYAEHLDIRTSNYHTEAIDIAFVNSKGFGGNNATAPLLSPSVVLSMIAKRHGIEAVESYYDKNLKIKANQANYSKKVNSGEFDLIYRFGEDVINEENININEEEIYLPGYELPIVLSNNNPFKDMC